MKNPLLTINGLPEFSKIKPQHIEPALERIINDNLAQLDELLQQQPYTWDNLFHPMEIMEDKLNSMWSVVGHLKAVMNTDELRDAYNHCLPKLSDYATAISHNEKLYQATVSIAEGKEYQQLDDVQRKVISDALRDFRLAGIGLAKQKKAEFAQLQKQLATLTTQFEENLLDATQGWTRHITDKKLLDGLPEHALASAAQVAQQKKIDGWLFTLELPSYISVMTYADNRQLRKEMYIAYVTRASEQGPNKEKYDNTTIMHEILAKRQALAELLGFNNYADYSLATKMAKNTKQVLEFIQQLADASLNQARKEYEQLGEFAKQQYHIDPLEPWDIMYFSEKLRQQLYDISQQELRPYFPEYKVLDGLFSITNKLYSITIVERHDVDTWQDDVRFFEIYDGDELLGQFYLDLYARLDKRGGAWMDECRVRRRLPNGNIQTPVAFITTNFNPPVGNDPALFSHDDVQTIFHEFGHGLQHMLTKIDYADVSGINGIPWDAVEIASQFMEHWCWQQQGLEATSEHYKTGKSLPKQMYQRLLKARNFQSAMQMVRQLEFALFDFRIHMEFSHEQQHFVQTILDEVRERLSVTPIPSFNRFQHSFSHIFSGGYAAGYYSYKWAELFASDAFAKFEETGIFNPETGQQFRETLLESGGAKDPMELFIMFRGRKPSIEPLLKHSGIQ